MLNCCIHLHNAFKRLQFLQTKQNMQTYKDIHDSFKEKTEQENIKIIKKKPEKVCKFLISVSLDGRMSFN